jgi:redox-sensitive bicupin YhaK (pirin superfamily)
MLIAPHEKDIGFPVRRLLPSAQRQRVGPFIFFDHMGPATFKPDTTVDDVRAHPHIGLATVTYLFSGAMMHRDSLGVVQRIEPGAINLMTAGRGVAHSERIPLDIREQGTVVEGLQLWLALPAALEQSAPAFAHTPAEVLPSFAGAGWHGRVMIGAAFGKVSPVRTPSPTTYVELRLSANARCELPASDHELALYVVDGHPRVNGVDVPTHHLLVREQHAAATVQTGDQAAHLMLLGGEPLAGERFINWNFVASRRELIDQARDDWRDGRFAMVPGETERIPLPQ